MSDLKMMMTVDVNIVLNTVRMCKDFIETSDSLIKKADLKDDEAEDKMFEYIMQRHTVIECLNSILREGSLNCKLE